MKKVLSLKSHYHFFDVYTPTQRIFLFASDCQGRWKAKELKQLLPLLNPVIRMWDDDEDRLQGLRLLRGFETAIEKKGVVSWS